MWQSVTVRVGVDRQRNTWGCCLHTGDECRSIMTRKKTPSSHTMDLHYIYQVPACLSTCNNWIQGHVMLQNLLLFFVLFHFRYTKLLQKPKADHKYPLRQAQSGLSHMEVLSFVSFFVIVFHCDWRQMWFFFSQKALVYIVSNITFSPPLCHWSSAVLRFKMISGSMSLSDNVCAQACNFPSNLFLSPMVTRAQLGLSPLTSVILLTWIL